MSVSITSTSFIIVSVMCLLLCEGAHNYNSPANRRYVENDQSQPFHSTSTHFESEPEDDDADVGGGRVRLRPSTFSFNDRYHSSTTTHPPRRLSQPYFGQSSSVRSGSSNYMPTLNHGGGGEAATTNGYNSGTAIIFRDKNTSLPLPTTTTTSSPGMIARGGVHGSRRGRIPLQFLRKLSNENDVTQIFAKYVSNVKVEDVNGQKQIVNLQGSPLNIELGGAPVMLQPTAEVTKPKITPVGFSDRKQPIAAAQKATSHAGCEPELQAVELPAPNDPSVVQHPRCVRLKRCGGCCPSDLLSCESIMSEPTEVQVLKFSYNDESEKLELEYKETETVTMSVDTSCRCNCRVKSGDCSARHEYSSDDCACICKNKGENEVCLRQPHKLWDPNLCQCVCRAILACSSGYSFDLDTCNCARIPDDGLNGGGGVPSATRKRRKTNADSSATFGQRN